MRKIIEDMLILIAIFIIFYLGGSFIEASFNIKEWPKETRVVIALISLSLNGIIIGYRNVQF